MGPGITRVGTYGLGTFCGLFLVTILSFGCYNTGSIEEPSDLMRIILIASLPFLGWFAMGFWFSRHDDH